MTHLTHSEMVRAIITAEQDGQAYCPNCGTPLNYDRGGLPNTAVFNTTTETITCHRCTRRPARQQPHKDQEKSMGICYAAPQEEPATPAIEPQPEKTSRHTEAADFTKPAVTKGRNND